MKYAIPVVAILASVPLFASGFHVTLATEILIFALFAMSLDIQVGYARMLSFGHVAPYGVGSYATAFALMQGMPLPAALLVGVAAATVLAVPMGWLCTRAGGVAFAMLTLAFAQLAYAIVFKWNTVTGGSDGLSGLTRNTGPFGFDGFTSRNGYYWLTLAVVVVVLLIVQSFVRSPMGTAIIAVRENEKRARAIGYNPRTLRLAAFVVSNAVAGVAGALHACSLLYVSPEILHWTLSGTVLVAAIVGGRGTLIGPMIGAAVIILAGHNLSAVTDSWPLFMGALFIVVVIAAPEGLWGLGQKAEKYLAARKQSRDGKAVGASNAAP